MAQQIQFRNGTAAAWTSANPVLALGELGLESDTRLIKIGDGVTAWTLLAYGTVRATTASGIPAATSFPNSPAAGQMVLRTDLKAAYIYTGSDWDEISRYNRVEPFLLFGL